MNIYDISKKAGVSIATVSRVLNGNDKVSEKTRKKVLSVMEEESYCPNAFARGLGLNTMKTIGILCADSSDSYLASAVYYLEQELRRFGYDALLCCTGYELEQKQKYLEILLSKRVDAIILAGSTFIEQTNKNNEYLCLAARKVPIILLNGHLDAPGIYSSLCDDTAAVADAADRLLAEKRNKLLFLYRSQSYSGRRKLEGFLRAHARREISVEKEQIICCNGSIRDIKERLLHDYRECFPFDGVITSDDELAIGVLKFAKSAGLSIPGDLSVIGYNNSKIGICCEPELTTIDNKLEFSCSHAVSVLMSVLNGKKVPAKTVITAEIILRQTTDNHF